MKYLPIYLMLLGLTSHPGLAQSRVSIAPTYWFNYGLYAYQIHSSYSGLDGSFAGRDVSSSVGLTARYHFTPQWDVSVGLLYTWYSSRLTKAPGVIVNRPYQSAALQLPLLVSYRPITRRLSPYFSGGTFLVKSQTFNEAPIKVNGVLGLGLDYRIHSGLSVLIQPTASYLFYKPADDLLYQYGQYNSYSLGVQTQLIWHF